MLDIFLLTSWFVCHEETIGHLFHYSKNFYILTYILKYTISVIKYVTKLVCGKCIIFPKGYLLICNTGLLNVMKGRPVEQWVMMANFIGNTCIQSNLNHMLEQL